MRKKLVVWICAITMLSVVGCGGKEKEPATVSETMNNMVENADNSAHMQENNPTGDSTEEEKGQQDSGTDISEEKQNIENGEKLEGDIRSIGESSVTVAKIEVFDDDDGKGAVMVSISNDDAELITVNISDNAKYVLRTVKNRGVNGDADVTETDASFSDLREDLLANFFGQYTSDNEFQADSVIIYKFI